MRILVWPLLSLPLFYPLMQEVHPFLVLLLQLGLDALILDVLEPIHLELGHRGVLLRVVVTGGARVSLRLGQLPLSGELDVVFVKDYLLDVVSWHLAHE